MKCTQIFKRDSRSDKGIGYLKIRIEWAGKQRVEFGTGYTVPDQFWDKANRELKGPSPTVVGEHTLGEIRMDVSTQMAEYIRTWRELDVLMKGDNFDARQFKGYLKGELDPINQVQESFETWVKRHISEFSSTPLPGHTRTGQKSTQAKYQTALDVLLLFSKETGEDLTWENMNHVFAKKMKAWRMSKPAHFLRIPGDTTPVSHNTVGKWMKVVRGFITRAKSLGIHKYDYTNHPEWTVVEEDIVRWSLTEQQLVEFLEFDIKDGKHPRTGLRRVRDLFVVQCCVGQRISDLQKVVDQFNEDPSRKTLKVKTKKTRETVPVPVMNLVRLVAERNGGRLPDVGAHQKYNVLLKKAARLSGLFEDTVLKGGINIKKSDLISSHVARRSFVTVGLNKGIPAKVIMAITGHKNEPELNRYNVPSDQQLVGWFEQGGFGDLAA